MKKVYTYPHTHWDFEWYFSYNESTIQLIYHMDDVIKALNNGTIDTYTLDGQMSIVEDYLRYVPKKRKIIEKLIKEKKLLVGPWFTQTDELVICGESIVRNLRYGIKSAREFGDYMPIGYLPDSFGQTQDLPKILNGFNINKSIFWRGVSEDNTSNREFLWKTSDGSEVVVYNIKNGYFFGGEVFMSNDDTDFIEKTITKNTSENIVMLPVGSDQRKVDLDYKNRIEYFNKKSNNNFEYIDSNPIEFMELLCKRKDGLQNVYGELIEPSDSKIHRSIFSSRYDHKYYNDKLERRMINILEPLMVMAGNLGLDVKEDMLEEIWKLLLRNHAHDSACGCNTDKTNEVILNRFKDVDQLSYSAMDYILRKLAISFKESNHNDIYLYNTTPIKKYGIIKIKVSTKSKNFIVLDKDSNGIEYDIITREKVYGGSIKRDEKDNDSNLYYYITEIALKVKLEEMSIKKIKLKETNEETQSECQVENDVNFIEDDYYKVKIEDGKVSILDKKNDRKIDNAIVIEESGDDGDTYDYSPPEKDKIYVYDFKNSKISMENNKLIKKINIKGNIVLPEDLKEREKEIAKIVTPYELIIMLKNNELVELKLEIENRSLDHRMRVILKTELLTEKSITNSQFGIVKRDNTPRHLYDWKEIGWREEPTPIYPMINYTALENDKGAFTAYSKGIKEYQILDDSKIALTLFRAVGFLGKPDLVRRPGIASGNQFKYIETPDSQMLKKFKFKFAIGTSKKFDPVQANNNWLNYSIWIPYYQIQDINMFVNTLEYFKVNKTEENIDYKDLIKFNGIKNLIVSSIIPLNNEEFTIRLYNPHDTEVSNVGNIKINNLISAEYTNLNNEILKKIDVVDNVINLDNFKAGEIKTIKINIH